MFAIKTLPNQKYGKYKSVESRNSLRPESIDRNEKKLSQGFNRLTRNMKTQEILCSRPDEATMVLFTIWINSPPSCDWSIDTFLATGNVFAYFIHPLDNVDTYLLVLAQCPRWTRVKGTGTVFTRLTSARWHVIKLFCLSGVPMMASSSTRTGPSVYLDTANRVWSLYRWAFMRMLFKSLMYFLNFGWTWTNSPELDLKPVKPGLMLVAFIYTKLWSKSLVSRTYKRKTEQIIAYRLKKKSLFVVLYFIKALLNILS